MIALKKKSKADLVKSTYTIRYIGIHDLAAIHRLEKFAYESPFTLPQLHDFLSTKGNAGKLLLVDDTIVGFITYSFTYSAIEIVSLVIHKVYQRLGLASLLLGNIIEENEVIISIAVAETSLDTQLFLQSMGFIAEDTILSPFDDSDESAYWFVLDNRKNKQ